MLVNHHQHTEAVETLYHGIYYTSHSVVVGWPLTFDCLATTL